MRKINMTKIKEENIMLTENLDAKGHFVVGNQIP